MEKKSAALEPLWDRMDPTGKLRASWTAYLAAFGKPDAWMGELDLLAAADKWALRMVVVRPGQPTIVIGRRKGLIWMLFRDKHFEPPEANTDPACSLARRQHIDEVDPCFQYSLDSGKHPRDWSFKGGGCATSTTTTCTLRAGSN
eukprot:9448290-Pyramimonas_sp.AAC.1